MLIRVGFDIQFDIPSPVAMIALFHVHPSRRAYLREPDEPQINPPVAIDEYEDSFGNRCSRFVAPAGKLQLYHSTLLEDSGEPDLGDPNACQVPVENLPPEALRYLLASRYCEVDRFLDIAGNLFGNSPPGWLRVQAVCDWVQRQRYVRLSFRQSHENGWRRLRGSQGRLPRFSASGDHVLPLSKHPCALRYWILGGHRSSSQSADGFQRMV